MQMIKDILVVVLLTILIMHAIWAIVDTFTCIKYKIKPARITIITYIVVLIGFGYLLWHGVM